MTTTTADGAGFERTSFRNQGFIASPAYDLTFFILAPLLALGVAESLAAFVFPFETTALLGHERRRVSILIGVVTYAHLFAVVFRSHANPTVFAQYKMRFTVVPAVLFVGFFVSVPMAIVGTVLAVLWDVYHTSMQNFGFCRIYDGKAGSPADQGRGLDMILNHFLYIGPILAGPSMTATLDTLQNLEGIGWSAPGAMLPHLVEWQPVLRNAILASGTAFFAYYVLRYRQLCAEGYVVSPQKIAVLVSTGGVSIYAWGFLPPFEAFFIANLFHAWQYFAIVWCSEQKNVRRVFGVANVNGGKWIALGAFAVSVGFFGLLYELDNTYRLRWAIAAGLTVSLMHFWYDGFIWSVRKKSV